MPIVDTVKKADIPTLVRWVKLINVINAGLLVTAGVMTFLTALLDIILIISSLYVIVFGLMWFCFECHLSSMDAFIYRNFGFMFVWQGRLVFFFFVGTLAFALGLIGMIAGGLTVTNVVFNIYVLCTNQHYKDQVKRQNAALKANVTKGGNKKTGAQPASWPEAMVSQDNVQVNVTSVDRDNVNFRVGSGVFGTNVAVPTSTVISVAKQGAKAAVNNQMESNSSWPDE